MITIELREITPPKFGLWNPKIWSLEDHFADLCETAPFGMVPKNDFTPSFYHGFQQVFNIRGKDYRDNTWHIADYSWPKLGCHELF